MKTVGELLQEEREKQGKTLKEISRKTKISLEVLTLLERNDFSLLPPKTFVQGFIRNYAKELGLDPASLLAIFRRDFKEKKKFLSLKYKGQAALRWTPKWTLIFGLALFTALFTFYLFWQFNHFWQGPTLKIESPSAKQEFKEKEITIEGQTDPEASLKINEEVVSLDEKGNFSKKIFLFEGENKIIIEAENRNSKKTTQERIVFYQQNP